MKAADYLLSFLGVFLGFAFGISFEPTFSWMIRAARWRYERLVRWRLHHPPIDIIDADEME
jgi:hypothetical protein